MLEMEMDITHIVPCPIWSRRRAAHHAEAVWFGGSWRNDCGDKLAYQSIEGAVASVRQLLRKRQMHNANGGKLSIYLCRWCEWFHIGHTHERCEHRNCDTVWVAING